jgi:hypothetical protein
MLIVAVPYFRNGAGRLQLRFLDFIGAPHDGDTRPPHGKNEPNYASKQCDSSRVQTDSKQVQIEPKPRVRVSPPRRTARVNNGLCFSAPAGKNA